MSDSIETKYKKGKRHFSKEELNEFLASERNRMKKQKAIWEQKQADKKLGVKLLWFIGHILLGIGILSINPVLIGGSIVMYLYADSHKK